jgi:hypothetical protein
MATPPDFYAGDVLTAAQMNAVGMWKITPTVSGTGVTVNSAGDVVLTAAPEPYINAFSADYRNYRIILQLTAFSGGAASLAVRMASGTTANTTASNYRNIGYEAGYGASSLGVVGNNGSTAGWNVGRVDSSGQTSGFIMDIQSPFASAYTQYSSVFRDWAISGYQSGYLQVVDSYNSFNPRIGGTNTMTGIIQVFGYN